MESQIEKAQSLPIIHIIGLPGAGKTTLAERLGKTLKVPVFCIGDYRTRFPQTAIREASGSTARNIGINMNFPESFLKAFVKFPQIVILILIDCPRRRCIGEQ